MPRQKRVLTEIDTKARPRPTKIAKKDLKAEKGQEDARELPFQRPKTSTAKPTSTKQASPFDKAQWVCLCNAFSSTDDSDSEEDSEDDSGHGMGPSTGRTVISDGLPRCPKWRARKPEEHSSIVTSKGASLAAQWDEQLDNRLFDPCNPFNCHLDDKKKGLGAVEVLENVVRFQITDA